MELSSEPGTDTTQGSRKLAYTVPFCPCVFRGQEERGTQGAGMEVAKWCATVGNLQVTFLVGVRTVPSAWQPGSHFLPRPKAWLFSAPSLPPADIY